MRDGPEVAIRTESLTKIYGHRQIVLNGVDLVVERGSVLGVLGPNGAGKSTLVRLIMGLHVPTAGRVWVLGRRMTPNAAAVRRQMGYLCGDPKLPSRMTPITYLDFVGKLFGLRQPVRGPKLAALLRAVDLLGVSGEPLQHFSDGMRTRLALAASLINDPEVLIWDEPARGLDAAARIGMLQLMKNLAAAKTLIVCSHNLADLEAICDSVVVLNQGQIIFRGSLEALKAGVRPNRVEIALNGDRKVVAEVARSIQDLDELVNCSLQRNLLTLELGRKASAASVLANVLMTLVDRKIEMTDMRICGSAADHAIGELVIQEGRLGITRAYQTVAE
jgi:ABC-2 type transport system ATP-binding protein